MIPHVILDKEIPRWKVIVTCGKCLTRQQKRQKAEAENQRLREELERLKAR